MPYTSVSSDEFAMGQHLCDLTNRLMKHAALNMASFGTGTIWVKTVRAGKQKNDDLNFSPANTDDFLVVDIL